MFALLITISIGTIQFGYSIGSWNTAFKPYQYHRNWDDQTVFIQDESYWYPGLYLGAGFQTGNVTMGVRFDVLYVDNKSIYANPYNPFVRFYF